MLGRLGWIGLLCLRAAYAAPGDIETTFTEATTFERAHPAIATDGTIWVGGLGEVIHLSAEGRLLERYPCSCYQNRIRPVAHPKGGVVIGGRQVFVGEEPVSRGDGAFWIQANGQVAAAFKPPRLPNKHRVRFYAAGGLIWMFKDQELTALDEKGAPLSDYTYDWMSVEFVSSAPNGTVAVIGMGVSGTERRGKRKLAYYSAKGGAVVSEHEPPPSLTDLIAILEDGRFLVGNGDGLTRYLPTGEIDPSYRSPFSTMDQDDAAFAPRPDRRIMIAVSHGRLGELKVDEDDEHFILARLTKEGDLDNSFPIKEPVPGDPPGMVATDEWTYYKGPETRLYRIDSSDLRLSEEANSSEKVSGIEALKLAKGGNVLKENTRHLGNASVGAFPRGDGYDDLIVAEWGPIKGLVRLVNSKDPEKPWRREAVGGGWTSQLPRFLGGARVKRRIAIGKIDGDELDDVLEWRSAVTRNGHPSMHWYRGEEKDGQRTLSYDGKLDCVNLPSGVNFADVCLADIDGDGDNDILMRGTKSLMEMRFFREDAKEPALIWWRNDGVTNPWPMMVVDASVSYAGISVITEDDDSPPASNLFLEDLDGDNDPDIAVVPLKETVAQTWFMNQDGKFTMHGINLATGQQHGDEAVGPTIAEKDRPALLGYERWKGRVVARADVNGDGVPDRILAYPGFEIDDDDSDLTWKRGLKWENGKEAPKLPDLKGGMVLLPLLWLRRRNRSRP